MRRIVKTLYDLYIKKGISPCRNDFTNHLSARWPRWNYPHFEESQYRRLIDKMLGRCIRGKRKYISEDGDRKSLLVTDEGFKLINAFGFIDELFTEYSKTTAFLLGGGGVALIWLIKRLLAVEG